mmetsp:Transcript_55149/g.152766  ORF Transcript_55149/g.152766 Transcript_55149/m.152766 type:complete len:96 (+) Transcript_55149:695-982(+)
MSIVSSRPNIPTNNMDTTRSNCNHPVLAVPVKDMAATPLVRGLNAIKLAQTAFLSHVRGFKCWVYQKVSINPITTAIRAGAPGTMVTHTNAAAYR